MSTDDVEWIQWETKSGGNGHWYAVIGAPEPIDWTTAKDAAADLGVQTHLATITSAAEDAFISNSLLGARPDVGEAWLGGTQAPSGNWLEFEDSSKPWTWVTGEAFDYTNWRLGEPNNAGGFIMNEDWLERHSDGSWNDAVVWGSWNISFYLAESSVDPRGPDADGTPGRDIVNGTAGNDTIDGLDGDDILNGGAGDDTVNGGPGNDVLNGDAGADRLNGQDGADVLNGGSGDDALMGGAGDDVLNGDAGKDDLFADGGADVLNGGEEDDRLTGGDGNNTLLGGDGDDLLDGGAGRDVLYGGSGADVFVCRPVSQDRGPAEGVDRIMDFEDGVDRLDLTAFAFKSLDDLAALIQPKGPDTLINLSTIGGGDTLIAGINIFELSPDDVLI